MSKSHLFLRNEFGVCLEFKQTRGRGEKPEDGVDKKSYHRQREKLDSCRKDFEAARRRRHRSRVQDIDTYHFDMLSISFLKIADHTLTKKYCTEYGLSELEFSDMNQTVLFAIVDPKCFTKEFIRQVESFAHEDNDESTDFGLVSLIDDFSYWDSDSMKKTTGIRDSDAHHILLELVESTPCLAVMHNTIRQAMTDFLDHNQIAYREIESGIYQIDFIPAEHLTTLLDNFDVIQRIQSLHSVHIRPNAFGDEEKVADATLNLLEGAPTIGVIDTGVQRLDVLEPILEHDGIDLTKVNGQPYDIDLQSDSSHGTTVATLAAFGNNFYRDIEAKIVDADAKIFSIKVQSGQTGLVNIAGTRDAIIKAHTEYHIRIFNLSITTRGKAYNQAVSTYAYILDELAFAYDLLIFISVGNLSEEDIEYMQTIAADPHTSDSVKQFLKYPNHYYNPFITLDETGCHDGECMNLCEPSESMNNMSVGAIAESYNARHANHGLSWGRKFPAYYSRKYHIDYNTLINGTEFKNNQKNKNLFKPDIVMPGGDLLDIESKMLVLSPRLDKAGFKIEQNSGTSYAAPLAANIAAKIIRKYPDLNMQSVKALIINSADPINTSYLDQTIERLKYLDNEAYPDIEQKEKKHLSSKYHRRRLSNYISGHGIPDISKCLHSEDNRCTFVIEDTIDFDSHKVLNLNIPDYLLRYSRKGKLLTLTAVLCYKFKPKRADVLSYCPVHIAFNFGKSPNPDEPEKNAEEYARNSASAHKERMAIKSDVKSWSDDFYPASSKIFSNVQKMSLNISRDEIEKIQNQMSVVFRCTGRNHLEGTQHPFSFVLTIEQKDSAELDGNSLYDSLQQVNTVEAIARAALEAEV